MSFVRLVDVSFSYSGSVALLEALNLHFAAGWTGIVGTNGAGKSTLLRLILGELSPERGHVRIEPPCARVGYCPQQVEVLHPPIRDFAAGRDGASCQLMGELRLEPGDLLRWPTLSPGERKRWQIGAALALHPEVLMLDEPTDHLDAAARDLLIASLRQFQGVGILVSHDRALLDSLSDSTLVFASELKQTRLWRGNYSVAKAEFEAEQRMTAAERKQFKRQRNRLTKLIGNKRRHAATAEASARKRIRESGIHDHDARSMMFKGKTLGAASRLSRESGVLRRRQQRVSEKIAELVISKTKGARVFMDYSPAPARMLASIESELLSVGGLSVLENLRAVVRRDSRIHVAGPNGAGKTTLLRAILAALKLPESRILYLPQELTDEDSDVLLESVRQLGVEQRGQVLSIAAALGSDPDRLLASRHLSPGETRKLKIAWGLGNLAWIALLDEPTNHLDIPSIERVEAMLAEYPGALLIVTHDDQLARKCTSQRWSIENRTLKIESACSG